MTQDRYRQAVEEIAAFIMDGDIIDGKEHDMTIDDAFDTAQYCISLCRDVLQTDGSNLAPRRPKAA